MITAKNNNGQVTVEMDILEAVILNSVLEYLEEDYFQALDDAPEQELFLFNKELIKKVYDNFKSILINPNLSE